MWVLYGRRPPLRNGYSDVGAIYSGTYPKFSVGVMPPSTRFYYTDAVGIITCYAPAPEPMALVPVACKNCGGLFATGSLIGGSGNIAVLDIGVNTLEGACPRCGGDLLTIPGTYNVIAGVTTFLDGPKESREQIAALLEALRDAQRGLLSADELRSRVEAEAPEFVSILRWLPMDAKALSVWLALIIPVLLNVCDRRQAERHHQETLHQSERHHTELLERSIQDAERLDRAEVERMVDAAVRDLRSGDEPPSDSLQATPPESQ